MRLMQQFSIGVERHHIILQFGISERSARFEYHSFSCSSNRCWPAFFTYTIACAMAWDSVEDARANCCYRGSVSGWDTLPVSLLYRISSCEFLNIFRGERLSPSPSHCFKIFCILPCCGPCPIAVAGAWPVYETT